jgi:short-subunit dehydrogenase
MSTITDRTFAVVTGASSGIGLALAKQCATSGFDVRVCAEDAAIGTH